MTLRIQWPIGQTVGQAVIILVILVFLAEIAARNDFVQSYLPIPSIGSSHRNFDLKLFLLEEVVEKEGPVDCIFLGPSAVDQGIDPRIFRQSFSECTGQDIHCFNFGISALNMPAAVVVTKILNKLYSPKLIVLGMLPNRDDQGRQTEDLLLPNRWIQYQLGDFNIDGWLTEYFYAYRYYLRFRTWMMYPGADKEMKQRELNTIPYGYQKNERIFRAINIPPKPTQGGQDEFFFITLAHFEVSPRHLDALEQLLQMKSQLDFVVVEMPAHHTFLTYFGRGKRDYDQIITETEARTQAQDVLFLTTSDLQLIPDEGWADRSHMNHTGAQIFSQWLGKQIGEAVNQGILTKLTQ